MFFFFFEKIKKVPFRVFILLYGVPKTEQIDTLGALVSHIELNKSLTPHDMVEMELQKSKPFWLMVPLSMRRRPTSVPSFLAGAPTIWDFPRLVAG